MNYQNACVDACNRVILRSRISPICDTLNAQSGEMRDLVDDNQCKPINIPVFEFVDEKWQIF